MKAPVGLLSDRTVLRSKMEGPRPDKSYMFFLDKHPGIVLSLLHRDRISADGTLWSTTVQDGGRVNADRLGSLAQLLRKAAFLLSEVVFISRVR